MIFRIKNLIFLVVAFFSSCSSFSVVSDYDRSANFSTYKTYEIRDTDLEMNDIDKDRIISAMRDNMNSKGLVESSTPDIIINLKASYEVIINIKNISNDKRILFLEGYDPHNIKWGWGGPYNSYWEVKWKYKGSPVSHRRGGLIFDFVDIKSQKLIWQGMGNGIDIDNCNAKIKQIPKIVNEILKNFPLKSTKH